MSVTSTLHINFRGNAHAALEFYHSVLGGDLLIAPYAQVPAGQDPDEITRYWNALADGAAIVEDPGPAVFSPLYGKLVDRFGVAWIIDVIPPAAG